MPKKYADLVNKIKDNNRKYYSSRKLGDYNGSEEVLALSPRETCEFIVFALDTHESDWQRKTLIVDFVGLLMSRKLPFKHEEIIRLLENKVGKESHFASGIGRINKVIENYLSENELSGELKKNIKKLIKFIENDSYQTAETRKWIVKLKELSGEESFRNPLVSGETWSDAAIADVLAENKGKNVWLELLTLAQTAAGSAPKAKWLKTAKELHEKIGVESFKSHILKWFPLVDKPRTIEILTWSEWSPNPNLLINDVNADILKGLVWLCGEYDDAEIARSLYNLAISAYKKVPQIDLAACASAMRASTRSAKCRRRGFATRFA